MVSTCAAYGCNNRAKRGGTVRFHKFPSIKRADLSKKWTLAMNRFINIYVKTRLYYTIF